MPFFNSLAHQWDKFLTCFITALTFFSDDDVACLALITILCLAGGDYRRCLFDGFRCDCIKLFLHPASLEFAYQTIRWWAAYGVSTGAKQLRSWTSISRTQISSMPRTPRPAPLVGTSLTTVMAAD